MELAMSSQEQIEARLRVNQQRKDLIDRLRESGHAVEADNLRDTYHARDVGALADDVYLSAAHEGQPPAGWTRASADPAALRQAGVDLTDLQIRELLQPRGSGFRAEIYVPDPEILGPDVKMVVAYKGSMGKILDPSRSEGLRESGSEDFSNNFQQAVGMQSDYYDRAMLLAFTVKRSANDNFEITGHSLGGGMGSAGSAVSGARATTFNAAGLNPLTADRFAKFHDLPVFNTNDTVHTYQTSGEVLNDAQNGQQRLSERYRQGFGLLASETSQFLRQPGVKEAVKEKLGAAMSEEGRAGTDRLVERLATTSGAEALRNVPLAAGKLEILLDAKTTADGKIVDRPHQPAPSQVAELAGPMAGVFISVGKGMEAGRRAGEVVSKVGTLAGESTRLSGAAVERAAQLQGSAIGTVIDYGGMSTRVTLQAGATVIAKGRELEGMVEATRHRVLAESNRGWNLGARIADAVGADALAERMRQSGDAGHAEHTRKAAAATQSAAVDAQGIRAAGDRYGEQVQKGVHEVASGVRQGYDAGGAAIHQAADRVGHGITSATDRAPAVLAGAGAVAAGSDKALRTYVLTPGVSPYNTVQTMRFGSQILASANESMARHGMSETVLPSLDAEVARQEAAAQKLLAPQQERAPVTGTPAPVPPKPAPVLNEQGHIDFPLFLGAQAGVHALDRAHNRVPDLQSDQLAGALAAQAKREGLQTISHVVLSDDRARAFAVDTADLNALQRRHAHVEVAQGMAQPLAVSTAQVDALNAGRTAAVDAGLAQQQVQESQEQARRMG